MRESLPFFKEFYNFLIIDILRSVLAKYTTTFNVQRTNKNLYNKTCNYSNSLSLQFADSSIIKQKKIMHSK